MYLLRIKLKKSENWLNQVLTTFTESSSRMLHSLVYSCILQGSVCLVPFMNDLCQNPFLMKKDIWLCRSVQFRMLINVCVLYKRFSWLFDVHLGFKLTTCTFCFKVIAKKRQNILTNIDEYSLLRQNWLIYFLDLINFNPRVLNVVMHIFHTSLVKFF